MSISVSAFLERWKGSAGNERANKDSFLRDFCEAWPGKLFQICSYWLRNTQEEPVFQQNTLATPSNSGGAVKLTMNGTWLQVP